MTNGQPDPAAGGGPLGDCQEPHVCHRLFRPPEIMLGDVLDDLVHSIQENQASAFSMGSGWW